MTPPMTDAEGLRLRQRVADARLVLLELRRFVDSVDPGGIRTDYMIHLRELLDDLGESLIAE